MPGRVLRGVLNAAPASSHVDVAAITRVFNAVAERIPFAHNCMHRSLALQRVLARRRVVATLRIGLGRKPNLFPGHAWLEIDGQVINDDPSMIARYTPLTISEEALHATWQ